jgi:DNA-binding transcriptional MerR regulator/quercetin dioxygenase-like cupin family protein
VYIKQAAQMVGVSAPVLRMWERQGLVRPERSRSGYRIYTLDDLQHLRRIRDLVHRDGFNIAAVRHVLESPGRPTQDPAVQEPVGRASQLSRRLKRLRTEQGVSIRGLAARTGLSASYISALERSRSSPSVASLQKLAAALGTNLDKLLGDEDPARNSPVVRPTERRRLNLDIPGVTIEQLAVGDTRFEASLTRIAPGCGSGDSYHHEGEEFVYVLEGVLEVTLEESTTYLAHGHDALTFPSHLPHRWRNPSESETTAIWINSPPTF